MKKVMTILSLLSLTLLSGCAVGSATSAVALRAHTADSLTAQGEARVVERARQEILRDLNYGYNVSSQQY
jgi:hypothetical protein